jgi:hypothetical protein
MASIISLALDEGGDVDSGEADPLVHVMMEVLARGGGELREVYERRRLDTIVTRSRFTAPEDRAAACQLMMQSMGLGQGLTPVTFQLNLSSLSAPRDPTWHMNVSRMCSS